MITPCVWCLGFWKMIGGDWSIDWANWVIGGKKNLILDVLGLLLKNKNSSFFFVILIEHVLC